jgi:Peptidase M15
VAVGDNQDVGSSWNLRPRSSVAAAVVAVTLAVAVAACGSAAETGTGVSTASNTSTNSGTGTSTVGGLIPKPHARAVEPQAGSDPSAKPKAAPDPVGDPTAHAQPLSKVKQELAKLNLCGGTNDPAQATPFGTNHGWGFVADPGTVQDVGELPIITRDLNELGMYLHVTIYGISGYRTPAHSVAVGGYADDPHTKGEAEDIGVNSLLRASAAQITEAEMAKFGLYRPFDPTDAADNTEVNHVQLIPNGGPVPVTVVDDTFDPDPSCT